MTRILLLGAALLVGACTASSDDVGEAGEYDTATLAEGVSVCPDNLVLDVDDYPEPLMIEADSAEAYHAQVGANADITTTPSGLQYRVVSAGLENGMQPRSGEEVFANYHGVLTDGTMFDSSYVKGSPFITQTTRVIRGWTEALEGMVVCEARTLYLPASLAYGQRGAGRDIKPGDSLIFHMQLLRVNRDGVDPVGVDRD